MMNEKLERISLLKSILYEAEMTNKLTTKVDPNNEFDFCRHSPIISTIVNYYLGTKAFWKYTVDIHSEANNIYVSDTKITVMIDWLVENEIAYQITKKINNNLGGQQISFQFTNQNDAAAFKLKFT